MCSCSCNWEGCSYDAHLPSTTRCACAKRGAHLVACEEGRVHCLKLHSFRIEERVPSVCYTSNFLHADDVDTERTR